MLNSELLTGALKTLNFQPEIDLFASWFICWFFCTFRPDPEAWCINAFTISWTNKKLYHVFSSFQLYFTGAAENHSGSGNLCGSGSRLADPSMVPSADISPHHSSSQASPLKKSTETTSNTNNCTPSSQEHISSYLFPVQQQLAGLGFTERSIKVITASWREGTTAQYQSHLRKWIEFCKEKKCSVLSPDLPVVLDSWERTVLQHREHS